MRSCRNIWHVGWPTKQGMTRYIPRPTRSESHARRINELSVRDSRVVITKDADFVNTFILHGRPYKLLLVSTGNITTTELVALFRQHLPELTKALQWHSYLELSREQLVIHR